MPVLAGSEPFRHTGNSRTGVSRCRGVARGATDGVGTDPAWVADIVLHNGFRVATLGGDAPLLFERGTAFAAAVRQVGTK
ncbi:MULTISPECIES: hypothetical protein [Prauserella salsuginis group]|uniref:Uncharacterized protein n=2 Tax=Prauserella salsuginis group TaxID=2893672 RepID=A0A839XQM3_9PSEU|nr:MULTISPECIES: hypothetical protein [Prauserella salsuginis group]MBB3665031.1 hypothetical protein [Prauserella sediminis]MCR3718502.1 hypothetical protein [Prauserella flava]MCR3733072.1 hypothetical protein [Prauserella salsuginis]